MASVVGAGQVKLNNGQTVAAQQGGWYDAQQYWGGSLSAPGVINSQSNQQGAGQAVSKEVNQQTSVAAGKAPDANQQYIDNLNAHPPATQQVTDTGAGLPGQPGGAGTGVNGGGVGAGALGALGGGTGSALNLPDLYKGLSDKAGIADQESAITAKTDAFNKAQSQINDNPYLSEAMRTGRLQKLTTDYNNDVKTSQDALTMAKQDVQTQIDLATKQFDINSQQAQQALSEFNMLLSSGALAGASGADVASITAATGISSGEIQAAISSQTQKDTPTTVTTLDDGQNQYAVVINTKTGTVISKSVLGASKPAAASATATKDAQSQQYEGWASQDAKNGATLQQLTSTYGVAGGLSIDDIYRIYNSNSKYGQAKETLAQAKSGVFANQPPPQQPTQQRNIFGIPY